MRHPGTALVMTENATCQFIVSVGVRHPGTVAAACINMCADVAVAGSVHADAGHTTTCVRHAKVHFLQKKKKRKEGRKRQAICMPTANVDDPCRSEGA